MPIIITRCNNVYGKNQYPEKIIPKFTMQLLNGEKITVHGDGKNLRTFIHTIDVVSAIETILLKGMNGKVYNIGTNNEYSVMEIARKLIYLLEGTIKDTSEADRPKGESVGDSIEFIKDREFNDKRYSLDCSELKALGWEETVDFEKGLKETVDWYIENGDRYLKRPT